MPSNRCHLHTPGSRASVAVTFWFISLLWSLLLQSILCLTWLIGSVLAIHCFHQILWSLFKNQNKQKKTPQLLLVSHRKSAKLLHLAFKVFFNLTQIFLFLLPYMDPISRKVISLISSSFTSAYIASSSSYAVFKSYVFLKGTTQVSPLDESLLVHFCPYWLGPSLSLEAPEDVGTARGLSSYWVRWFFLLVM